MDDASVEIRYDLRRRAGFALATVGAMIFLAPWGSERLSLPRRAVEWLVCIAIWEAALWLARTILARRRSVVCMNGRPPFRAYLLTLGVASVPAVPLCMLVCRGTIGSFSDFALFYGDALGLGVILAVIHYGMRAPGAVTGEVASADITPGASLPAAGVPCRDFLGRHAPDLAGATLLALAAEDHYLRIHTDRGQALALLRLRDAIDSLGESTGVQVHRSFWVARHAAPQAARRGQAWQLDLPSGLSIPVSRTRIPACREAGWL